MDVKCPRCRDEFKADDIDNDAKCRRCGLFIKAYHDDNSYEYFD